MRGGGSSPNKGGGKGGLRLSPYCGISLFACSWLSPFSGCLSESVAPTGEKAEVVKGGVITLALAWREGKYRSD